MKVFLLLLVQSYIASTTVKAAEITYPASGTERRAILELPEGKGPFPALFYCHGSGHRLFWNVGPWWKDVARFLKGI